MTAKKPRKIIIGTHGSKLEIKPDGMMSNFWIGQASCSVKDAKKLKKWIDKYLEHDDAKPKHLFTVDNLEDIWSGLGVWQNKVLDRKQNPETDAAITRLIEKVRRQIKIQREELKK